MTGHYFVRLNMNVTTDINYDGYLWSRPLELTLVPLVGDLVELWPNGTIRVVKHRVWVPMDGFCEINLRLESVRNHKDPDIETDLRKAGWAPV